MKQMRLDFVEDLDILRLVIKRGGVAAGAEELGVGEHRLRKFLDPFCLDRKPKQHYLPLIEEFVENYFIEPVFEDI